MQGILRRELRREIDVRTRSRLAAERVLFCAACGCAFDVKLHKPRKRFWKMHALCGPCKAARPA